ncbi:MAG: M28 family peptidase [Spirochaetia bacterium]
MNDLPADLFRDLSAFINTNDRFGFLRYWLHRCGIRGRKIELKGHQHLLIRFDQHQYSPYEKTKVFVAHYDRVPGTPGANDNSAAVFQLLCHAGRLSQESTHYNVQILFTDGEELLGGNHPNQQGAYQIANLLREQGIHNCRFYVFDMCGIGDCIVIGGAGSLLLQQARSDGLISANFYNAAIQELQFTASKIREFQGRPADWIYSSFSDDLGLLLGGYPASCISVLPTEEAATAHSNWKQVTQNETAMLSLKRGYLNPAFQKVIHAMLPQTWQTWHSPEDRIDLLERRSFVLMENFLTFLTKMT